MNKTIIEELAENICKSIIEELDLPNLISFTPIEKEEKCKYLVIHFPFYVSIYVDVASDTELSINIWYKLPISFLSEITKFHCIITRFIIDVGIKKTKGI